MHNNHGGGSPGGHTAVHHHQHQGRILPRNRRALMCIDKHDDDVQARPPHAKINQVRAPMGNTKRRTTDTLAS